MNSHERSRDEIGLAERLTARFVRLWEEHRCLAEEHRCLAEERNALESSTAWAVVQRLRRWWQRFAPEGSLRQAFVRQILCGFSLRRRPETRVQAQKVSVEQSVSIQASRACLAAAPARQNEKIRIAYIGSRWSIDAATMRYRAHNLIEGLPLAGLEGTFVAEEEIHSQLSTILSHDLIVLVRRISADTITTLIGLARRRGLPIVFDIDDYIFDPWVMPYVEALHGPLERANGLRLMDKLGACLDQCEYFTGSTPYLAERAAALGKESFVIHNGFNSTQLLLSQTARDERGLRQGGQGTRIGYFSGTRTHQADFRVAYPALMRLLREDRSIRLVIVGQLDVGVFPGLALFMDQIDLLPMCHWNQLPEVIASVDINIIPLDLTPFNEGKSNLKYYEAGLVEVPSVASPTGILRDSITHGHNGLLARTTEEWYNGLKELVARPELRRQMGRNAYEQVMQTYTPSSIAAEAVAVYRQILRLHLARRDNPKQPLSIVMLVADLQSEWEEPLRRANELAAAGHTVTVHVSPGKIMISAAALTKSVARLFFEPLFALQYGGAIPCCDVLIAVDSLTTNLAKTHQHLAQLTIADEDRLSLILKADRCLEPLLREWVQNGPSAPPPSQAA
jgi:glycosyltransferase involved in cell wall biosynthesis